MKRVRMFLGGLVAVVVAVMVAVAVAAAGAGVGPSALAVSSDASSTTGASPGRPVVPVAPLTSPARVEAPVAVAVVGDSLSQGTGANGPGSPGGSIGSPRLGASWATGTSEGLDSYTQRLAHLTGRDVVAHNLSANGATIAAHLFDQVRSIPEHADLVLVQMGGNDLCRPSEHEMTPVDLAREQVRASLDWLTRHRPDTLVSMSSIPDIYSLWYVRGAAHRGEQYPVVGFVVSGREGPRAPRSFVENNNKRAARILWDTLGVVPCRSLLFRPNVPRNAGPTPDPTNSAEQRRLRVRAHNIALNEMLAEECAAVLRCRFDGHALFDLVSNRDEHGHLLADKAQWRFDDADISTQDHFHPSFRGQRKMAEVAWSAGHDWTDSTPPTGHLAVRAASGVSGPSAAGWFTGPAAVDVWFGDDVGVRGLEYRVHGPGGSGASGGAGQPPWTAVLDDRVTVEVTTEGTSWVEARALDVNGNTSASQLVEVRIDREAPTVRIEAPAEGEVMTLGGPVVARYECEDAGVVAIASGVVSCDGPVRAGVYVDASAVGVHTMSVRAVDAAGHVTVAERTYRVEYAWSGPSIPGGRVQPLAIARNQPVPMHVSLTDVRGRPVPEAWVDVVLVGSDGAEHPARSWIRGVGHGRARWSEPHGGHVLVIDTRGLDPGEWQLVVRPDDGTERRLTLLLES